MLNRPHRDGGSGDVRSERGASLVIALLFMTVLSVIVAGLFYMAFGNIRTMRQHRIERTMRYNADAALELAVNRLRNHTEPVSAANPCLGGGTQMKMIEANNPDPILTINSKLDITCEKDANVDDILAPGEDDPPRQIVIEVVCQQSPDFVDGQVWCGDPAGSRRVVATALVRFEPGPSEDGGPAKATIPKILQWNVDG